MPAVLAPYANTYLLGRGRFLFDPLIAGVYQGFVPFGNVPEASIEIEGEELEHKSSESGLAETDLKKLISIERTMTLVCDNISPANIALFLGATVSKLTQIAGTVTAELIDAKLTRGSTYQLGASPSNPTGANRISAVSLTPGNAAFAVSTTYVVGQVVTPITPTGHAYYVTVAGTSAATEPTWPTTSGATIVSGTVTFKQLINFSTLIAATDYVIDAKNGLVSVLTGAISTASDTAPLLRARATYTKAATTTEQVATGAGSGVQGRMKFLSENPLNDTEGQWFFPSVSLAPNGELPLITEGDVATVEFSVGINKLDSITAAIYRNGEPVDA